MEKTYPAIDLKSYYASAECAARHLDPLTTNLVVADASRTEKTICLAVSPSLKSYGIPGRARLFKVEMIDGVFRQITISDGSAKVTVPFDDLEEVSGEGIVNIDEFLGISDLGKG